MKLLIVLFAVWLGIASAAEPQRNLGIAPVSAEKRVALVIGNAAYKSGPLVNPVNDARAMASVLAAADDGRRMRLIEDFLAPRWQAIHTEPTARPRQFHDWSQGVARRAARHGGGCSDRQIDRRIKAWTGQALRHLRGIGRSEDLLFRARQAFDSKEINWSDIASASGYADQAHLCRELRRITGLRPNELRKMIAHESYWMYQVWARIPD